MFAAPVTLQVNDMFGYFTTFCNYVSSEELNVQLPSLMLSTPRTGPTGRKFMIHANVC